MLPDWGRLGGTAGDWRGQPHGWNVRTNKGSSPDRYADAVLRAGHGTGSYSTGDSQSWCITLHRPSTRCYNMGRRAWVDLWTSRQMSKPRLTMRLQGGGRPPWRASHFTVWGTAGRVRQVRPKLDPEDPLDSHGPAASQWQFGVART